ncbi:MAG: YicC family protein [Oscillospiraceae bacterium]|nr:YicC family protein [Oscillospiraceae bacterium]
MIRSMTGFGREQRIIDGREITAEIRSVNHRYHEFSAKTPYQYRYIEEKLKALVGGRVSRGKVEVVITIHNLAGKEVKVALNRDVVESYIKAVDEFQMSMKPSLIIGSFSPADVLRIPDAFTVLKAEVDEDAVWQAVESVTGAALEKFVSMRETEGVKMKSDILERLDFIESATAQIEAASPERVEKYRLRLIEKMNEVISKGVDEQRILLEAAIFAEKTAVDEETVRLRSHISQVRELLEKESVVGRKLDFIVQEMNREINTIGSKSHEIEITRIVVELKGELEKIREQIQNVE